MYAIDWISLDTSAKIVKPKQFLRTRLGGKYIVLPMVKNLQCAFDLEQILAI